MPAPPDAPVAPEPPVSPGKMRCFPVWIAAIAGFCLLLMSCNFFQAGSGVWRAGVVMGCGISEVFENHRRGVGL